MDGNSEGEAGVPSEPEAINEALTAEKKREIALKNLEFSDRPGIPKGTELASKRTYPKAKLVQATAEALMAGKPGPKMVTPRLEVTEADRKMLHRVCGASIEEFQAEMTATLQEIGTLAGQTCIQHLKDGTFRPDTVPAVLAISIDKLQAMNGRANVAGSVNVQINNFGNGQPQPRESVLSQLGNLRGGKSPEMVEAIAV